jgi:hypothetical protein
MTAVSDHENGGRRGPRCDDAIARNVAWIRAMQADGYAFDLRGNPWDLDSYHINRGTEIERDCSAMMIEALRRAFHRRRLH